MRRVVFKVRFLPLVLFAMLAGVWPMAAQAAAATTINLGTAANFAVLGGSTVTNTGATTITGDVGVSPGTSITGFPPGILISGALQAGNPAAANAQAALTTAYNNAAGQVCPSTNKLTGVDLGGKTLLPGVYCFNSSAQLTGQLTLDFQGNPNAVFIFQIGSTLTTASGSSVRLINYTKACSVAGGGLATPLVFWQVGSSATLGTTTAFAGTIMALTSITMTTGATLNGRALARNGAVTLDTNIINTCGSNPVGCKQGSGKDTDENADQSKNVAAGNESVKGDTDSASDRSENCDSGNSDKDKNNQDKNNQDKNNQDKNNQDKNNQDKKKS